MSNTKFNVNIGVQTSSDSLTNLKTKVQSFLSKSKFSISPQLKWTKGSVQQTIKEINAYTKSVKDTDSIKLPISFSYSASDLKKLKSQLQSDIQSENKLALALELNLDSEKSKAKIQKQLSNIIANVTKNLTVDLSASKKEQKSKGSGNAYLTNGYAFDFEREQKAVTALEKRIEGFSNSALRARYNIEDLYAAIDNVETEGDDPNGSVGFAIARYRKMFKNISRQIYINEGRLNPLNVELEGGFDTNDQRAAISNLSNEISGFSVETKKAQAQLENLKEILNQIDNSDVFVDRVKSIKDFNNKIETTNDLIADLRAKDSLNNDKVASFDVGEQTESLNNLKDQLNNLEDPAYKLQIDLESLYEILDRIGSSNSVAEQVEDIQKYEKSLASFTQSLNVKSRANEDTIANAEPIVSDFFDNLDGDGSNQKLETLKERINALAIPATSAKQKIAELSNEFNKLKSADNAQSITEQANAIEKWNKKIEKLGLSVGSLAEQNNAQIQRNQVKIEQLANSIQTFENQYRSVSKNCSIDIASYKTRLSNLSPTDTTGIKNLNNEWSLFVSNLKASGDLTETVFQVFKKNITKFMQWYGTSNFATKSVHALKSMFTQIKSIDTAMTNLRKVTDATDSSFNSFLTNAYSNAKKLGVVVTDLIDATAEFSRLGYSLDESTILGQAAVLYKNVGDGITADEASKSIISTMKAFGIEAENVETEIVDKFNEIGKIVPKKCSNTLFSR